MLSIWVTIILLALSWYPLTGFYAPANVHYQPPIWFSVLTLTGAVIFGFISCSHARRGNISPALCAAHAQCLVWLAVSVFFAFFIPLPYALPAYGIFIAILISMTLEYFTRQERAVSTILQRIARSFLLCGLILAAQAIVHPFFVLWASRYHHLPWLAKPAAALLWFFGHPTASANGEIHLQNIDAIYTILPTWEALSHYLIVLIIAGAASVFFTLRLPKRYYVLLPLILFVYMFIRFIFAILAYTGNGLASDFWRLDLLALSLIPLPFVLHRFLPLVQHPPKSLLNPEVSGRDRHFKGGLEILPIEKLTPSRNLGIGDVLGGVTDSMTNTQQRFFDLPLHHCSARPTAACFALAIFAWIAFFGFSDPGIEKSGKILIDEKHSNWEWTTDAFDTSWYGEKSTYNYYSLAEYLSYFRQVERNFDALTDDVLAQHDILFVKTPTTPFAKNEIAAIKKFVTNGGGLFLIGDHTNVFGTTTHLNPLANEFGFCYRYDGQYDLEGEQSIYRKPDILPHPVVQNLPPFLFATGCMLKAPLWAENAITGYGVKSLALDYSQKNFFPKEARNNPRMAFGLFLQAGGRAFGKGRVFLFTDSTVWSNFYMFIPGKPELLLGIIDWLNRRNRLPDWLRPALALFGLMALAGSVYCARRLDHREAIATALFTVMLVVPLASKAIEMLNRYNYPRPVPHTKFTQITFESQYSHFELPLFHVTQFVDHSIHTFYVWLQRLGYVPALQSTLAEALQAGDAVVLVKPSRKFTEADIRETEAFLQRGGRLLVIDDPRGHQFSHANQLLARFGIALHSDARSLAKVRFLRAQNDTLAATAAYAGVVAGGEPLVWAQIVSHALKSSGAKLSANNIPLNPSRIPKFRDGTGTSKRDGIPAPGPIPPSKGGRGMSSPGDAQTNAGQSFKPKFRIRTETERFDPAEPWPVLAVKEVGKGRLVAMASAALFTDEKMGFTTAQPTKNMRRIFELEYWIFRDVLGLGARQ